LYKLNRASEFDHVAFRIIGEVVNDPRQVPSDVHQFIPAQPVKFGAVGVRDQCGLWGTAECSSGWPHHAAAMI
jgi:hypothetical protein